MITEAYIYSPQIMEKVNHWLGEVEDSLVRKQVDLSDDVELFLQIDGDDSAYYFVDHSSHTQFWLDAVDTDAMDLPPAVSLSHLSEPFPRSPRNVLTATVTELALQELYWIHVEYFPMHRQGLASSTLEDLIGVFTHALAGR